MELVRKILGLVLLLLGAAFVVLVGFYKTSGMNTLFDSILAAIKNIGSLSGDLKITQIVNLSFISLALVIAVFTIISAVIKSFSQKGVTKKYFKTLGSMIFAELVFIWFAMPSRALVSFKDNQYAIPTIIYGAIILVYLVNMVIGLCSIELSKTVGLTCSLKKFSAVKYRVMNVITLLCYVVAIVILNIGAFDTTYKLKSSIDVVGNTSLYSLVTYNASLYPNPAFLFYAVKILAVLAYLLILTSAIIAIIGIVNAILSFWYSDQTFNKADYFKKLSIKTVNNYYLGYFVIAVLYELVFAKSVYGSIQFNPILNDMMANLIVLGICFVGVILINGDAKRLDKQYNKKEEVPLTYDPNRKLSRKEKKELAKREAELKKEAEKAAKKEEKKRAKKAAKQAKKEQKELEEKQAKRDADYEAFLAKQEEEKRLAEENNIEIVPENTDKGDEGEC